VRFKVRSDVRESQNGKCNRYSLARSLHGHGRFRSRINDAGDEGGRAGTLNCSVNVSQKPATWQMSLLASEIDDRLAEATRCADRLF